MTSTLKDAAPFDSASNRHSLELRQKSPGSCTRSTGVLLGAAFQITGRRNRRMKNASVLSLATSAAVRRALSSPVSISSSANPPATCPLVLGAEGGGVRAPHLA